MSTKPNDAKSGRHYIIERQWYHKGDRYPVKDEIRVTAGNIRVAVRKATVTPMKGFRCISGANVTIKIIVGMPIYNDTKSEAEPVVDNGGNPND